MAPRAVWKGFLKMASVTCAVKLAGATSEADKVSFRILNRKTRTPVKSSYIDQVTEKPVEAEDRIKGFELDAGDFLHIEEEEIKALKVQSEHTLAIDEFVDPDAIPSLYREKPYYLFPADKASGEAFAVIREAMAKEKVAGVAYITLYQKERPVVVEPLGAGLLMTTMRYDNWVVDAKSVFSDLRDVKIDPEMAEIAELIIEKKVGKFDPSKFEDTYENALIEMINAKKAGKAPPKPVPAPKENVINLADVLRKSLEKEGVKLPAAKGEAKRKSA